MKNLLPFSLLSCATLLAYAIGGCAAIAAADNGVKLKAKARSHAALALAAVADPEPSKAEVKEVARAAFATELMEKCQECATPCDCKECDCGRCEGKATPKFTKAEKPKAEDSAAYRRVLKDVSAGEERFVYVGYRLPDGHTEKQVSLTAFDGKSRGVFHCFLDESGNCKYDERPELVPMKNVVQTRTKQVPQCEVDPAGRRVCKLVDQVVTEVVRVPDENPEEPTK